MQAIPHHRRIPQLCRRHHHCLLLLFGWIVLPPMIVVPLYLEYRPSEIHEEMMILLQHCCFVDILHRSRHTPISLAGSTFTIQTRSLRIQRFSKGDIQNYCASLLYYKKGVEEMVDTVEVIASYAKLNLFAL